MMQRYSITARAVVIREGQGAGPGGVIVQTRIHTTAMLVSSKPGRLACLEDTKTSRHSRNWLHAKGNLTGWNRKRLPASWMKRLDQTQLRTLTCSLLSHVPAAILVPLAGSLKPGGGSIPVKPQYTFKATGLPITRTAVQAYEPRDPQRPIALSWTFSRFVVANIDLRYGPLCILMDGFDL